MSFQRVHINEIPRRIIFETDFVARESPRMPVLVACTFLFLFAVVVLSRFFVTLRLVVNLFFIKFVEGDTG